MCWRCCEAVEGREVFARQEAFESQSFSEGAAARALSAADWSDGGALPCVTVHMLDCSPAALYDVLCIYLEEQSSIRPPARK
jgi:hypothetical protein